MTAILLRKGGQWQGLIVIRTHPVLVRAVLQKIWLQLGCQTKSKIPLEPQRVSLLLRGQGRVDPFLRTIFLKREAQIVFLRRCN